MRVLARAATAVLGVALLAAIGGCGGTGQSQVEGTITYGGEPIKGGSIAFLALEKGGVNSGSAIVDGRYHIPAEIGPKPGKYKVEIRWAKPTGEKFKSESGEMLDMTKEGLPEKYNDKSELTADVKPGKNVIDFPLPKVEGGR